MKFARYYNSPGVRSSNNLESILGFPNTGISPLLGFAHRLAQVANETSSSGSNVFYEDDDNFYARFDLPGVKKENLAVDLNSSHLELSVKQAVEKKADEENSLSRETVWDRSVSSPEGIDPQKVRAKLEDGVLTVTLPKSEASKPRSIQID